MLCNWCSTLPHNSPVMYSASTGFDGASMQHITELSGVSKATVYNTLHQFTDAGLLREVVVNPGTSHFDTNMGDHHHLYYEDSGELRDVEAHEIKITGLPPTPRGAEIARVDVVVRLRKK